MNQARPGVLATRAVSQYRRRDVVTFLGLRYYLENEAARTDVWARHVATDLASTRNVSPYFHAHHFKELDGSGQPEHRHICLPGANEALAESALLAECAKKSDQLDAPAGVFSYRLTRAGDRSGMFEHYIQGLCLRHDSVAAACDDRLQGVVQYLDIRRFYPSITIAMARDTWRRLAMAAGLPEVFVDLGTTLIEHHQKVLRPREEGILTGPMFSHFIGNLVLRELDAQFVEQLSVKYFRYVDDIILVGDAASVASATHIVEERLGDLGFDLHTENSPKRMQIPAEKWLEGRSDFKKTAHPHSWRSLVGDLKRFLVTYGDQDQSLKHAFQDEGFRLPTTDYSASSREVKFVERFIELARRRWFRYRARGITRQTLLTKASWLRSHCEQEFPKLLERAYHSRGFDRKRALPKLRFLAGRLVYLGSDAFLAEWSRPTQEFPELHLQGCVMEAVATKRVDHLLELGGNVAQAAAQPLSAIQARVEFNGDRLGNSGLQALAILNLNGVEITLPNRSNYNNNELVRFAQNGSDAAMMTSQDPYMRELACLHGLSVARHTRMLHTAFDLDDDLVLDAIDQLQNSTSS